jgi:hypothetical protein
MPGVLARPLINTSAFHAGRDLALSIAAAEESLQLSRQIGNTPYANLAASNLVVGLWTAARWREMAALLADETTAVDPAMKTFMAQLLARATGAVVPSVPVELAHLVTSEERQERAWILSAVAEDAAATDPAKAAALAAEATDAYVLTSGTDDDFVHHWSHAVELAAAAHDGAGVEELLDLVRRRPRGVLTPHVRAELARLRGTYSDAAEDREGDLRYAIEGLAAFGSPFGRARSEVVLAELLVSDGRSEEAAALLDSARATFQDLGAVPWLARAERVLSPV